MEPPVLPNEVGLTEKDQAAETHSLYGHLLQVDRVWPHLAIRGAI